MSFDQKIYQFDDCNSNRIDIRHPRGCHPIPLSKKVPKQLYELDEDFRPTFPVTFAGSLDAQCVKGGGAKKMLQTAKTFVTKLVRYIEWIVDPL